MDESPDSAASAKLAQHMAIAAQIAEAVVRLRQQRAEDRAGDVRTASSAARAQRSAQHGADRVGYGRALDPDWLRTAPLSDLGRAWGSAAGWADTDPMADAAATRVEQRLAEMAPAAMSKFDELRVGGLERTDAMRTVLAQVATEASSEERRVFVADPAAASTAAAADAQARADVAGGLARRDEATPDDVSTHRVDEHADAVTAAAPVRDGQQAWQAAADASAAASTTDAVPARLAAEHFPRPMNEVHPASSAGRPGSAAVAAKQSTTRVLSR